MASGVLAGVNPVYGLYASITGPIAGGLLTSTPLLLITTTSAAAVAAGQGIAVLDPEYRDAALFVLVFLVGALQVIAGFLRLGDLTRFVSHSVMTGFLAGVAAIVILGQLGQFVGYDTRGGNKIVQTIDLLLNIRSIDLYSTVVGTSALVLALFLPRTRLGQVGTVFALALPSALAVALGWTSVATVSSEGPIPSGLPLPALPDFSVLSFDLLTTAIAIAIIILVQGAGVSQSVPNTSGKRTDISRDFVAQGVANVVGGVFQGLPVGGSAGQTALNVAAGAQTRWAAVLCGGWMALILVLFVGLVGRVAMPTLAAVLILAGIGALPVQAARSIWHTGTASRLAMVVTCVATLLLPIQYAVALGVVLSAVLCIGGASTDISVVELVPLPDGRIAEQPAPSHLPNEKVTTLGIYGSLFYAGAWTLERLLPEPGNRSVVVLGLRGRSQLGATFLRVVKTYAARLADTGGQLYLAGVDQHVKDQLDATRDSAGSNGLHVVLATSIQGESNSQAAAEGAAWLTQHTTEENPKRTSTAEELV
jgi:SulP family sulfate permease